MTRKITDEQKAEIIIALRYTPNASEVARRLSFKPSSRLVAKIANSNGIKLVSLTGGGVRLSDEQRARIACELSAGGTKSQIARRTGCSRDTVTKVQLDIAAAAVNLREKTPKLPHFNCAKDKSAPSPKHRPR